MNTYTDTVVLIFISTLFVASSIYFWKQNKTLRTLDKAGTYHIFTKLPQMEEFMVIACKSKDAFDKYCEYRKKALVYGLIGWAMGVCYAFLDRSY